MSDPEKIDTETEYLFSLVKSQYGDRLNEAELEEVKKSVERIVETSEKLRNVKLGNWDEPFSVFIPFREEEE
jgi:hypothetical protein